MVIAELAVKLGLAGTGKFNKGMGGVRGQLNGVVSSSLASQAALAGMLYGLQRVMSTSAQMGMELQKFTNLIDVSSDSLQRWEYLGRQSGVTAGEMRSAFVAVNSVMGKMALGMGAPMGMNQLATVLGDFDWERAKTDTNYMFQSGRRFLKEAKSKGMEAPRANEIMRSIGFTDDVIQALRTSTIDLNKIPARLLFTPREVKELHDIGVAWMNLNKEIELAIGHLNARFGLKMTEDLSNLVVKLMEATTAFAEMAEAMKAAEGMGMIFDGWTMQFENWRDIFKIIGATINLYRQGSKVKVKGEEQGMKGKKRYGEGSINLMIEDWVKDKLMPKIGEQLQRGTVGYSPVPPKVNVAQTFVIGAKGDDTTARSVAFVAEKAVERGLLQGMARIQTANK